MLGSRKLLQIESHRNKSTLLLKRVQIETTRYTLVSTWWATHVFRKMISKSVQEHRHEIEIESMLHLAYLDNFGLVCVLKYLEQVWTRTSFFSFSSFRFKLNSVVTLPNRAYIVSSNYHLRHTEFDFLTSFFSIVMAILVIWFKIKSTYFCLKNCPPRNNILTPNLSFTSPFHILILNRIC